MFKESSNIVRILFGFLGLSSIAIEIIVLQSESLFNAANFFSFFTVISNTLAALYLIYFGVTNDYSRFSQLVRGALTLYMLMTGMIFAVMLSGLENVRLTAVPWDNLVLHYIMPFVVVLDWILAPPKKTLESNSILLWIAFPILYVIYTLVRGSIAGWYPYPFLNPSLSSYTQVLLISVIISAFVIVASFGIRALANKRLGQ